METELKPKISIATLSKQLSNLENVKILELQSLVESLLLELHDLKKEIEDIRYGSEIS